MRHLFPDKEVIGSVGLVPWRLYRGRANIVNVLWFTSARARKTALLDGEDSGEPEYDRNGHAGPLGLPETSLAYISEPTQLHK